MAQNQNTRARVLSDAIEEYGESTHRSVSFQILSEKPIIYYVFGWKNSSEILVHDFYRSGIHLFGTLIGLFFEILNIISKRKKKLMKILVKLLNRTIPKLIREVYEYNEINYLCYLWFCIEPLKMSFVVLVFFQYIHQI